jgi:hypothetical protein
LECGIAVYPARSAGGRWRAVWYEAGERRQCEAATEDKLALKLDKVAERLQADAPNMRRPALLDVLHNVGATGQVTVLLDRDPAAHVSVDDPGAVAALLDALHNVGARALAAELTERLPAAGLFYLFLRQEGRAEQFRFGREADGLPAGPWTWTDLG